MDVAELVAWLSFLRLPGIGVRGRHALLSRFGHAGEVFAAHRSDLEAVLGQRRSIAHYRATLDAIRRGPDEASVAHDLDWLQREGHHLVVWSDPDYPAPLREIADPPTLLFVRGDRSAIGAAQLAVVGSRNATSSGVRDAAAFARALGEAGLVITSGLALGIDAAAHRGALAGGGRTVAVAANGLDAVYPARNRELAEAIARQGAIISEYPIGTEPLPEFFPVRNRLISGLSLGVLVVEAAPHSGSLITAKLAAEQGREVFALPGSIHSPLSRGCHALIRDGAKLVETAEHVLEELRGMRAAVRLPTNAAPVAPPAPLAGAEAQVYAALAHHPLHVDVIVEASGLTPESVSSILLALELRGLVLAGPGGTYQLAP